jgi:transcriptional regulator with XRE-family HTH domain
MSHTIKDLPRPTSDRTPGQLLREARQRHRLSQKRLAIRAGTTQSAISRIESDRVSPSVDTLSGLLHLLGEDLEIGFAPRNWGIDETQVYERLLHTPEERVDFGAAFANTLIDSFGSPRDA